MNSWLYGRREVFINWKRVSRPIMSILVTSMWISKNSLLSTDRVLLTVTIRFHFEHKYYFSIALINHQLLHCRHDWKSLILPPALSLDESLFPMSNQKRKLLFFQWFVLTLLRLIQPFLRIIRIIWFIHFLTKKTCIRFV